MKEVTVVCTSCNRPDLLEKTLESFFKYNTYPIELDYFNVIDDSGVVGCNDHLKEKFPSVSFWYNPENIGQVATIDKMYGYVTTPYVFHMEEDWEFYKEGFIEACLDVIDLDEKIICVWTRDPKDIGHPLLPDKYVTENGVSIQRVSWGFDGHWHGFTFNPSLKKMKDYPENGYKPIGRELELSKYYYSLGYFAMAFTEGYCKHAGWGRHVTDIDETTGYQTTKNMNILEWEEKLKPMIIDNVNLILSILKDGDVFVDIGANTGLLSKLVLDGISNKNIKLSNHIIFEPIAKYCDECKLKFGDTTTINQFALSDTNETKTILASNINFGYNKIYKEGMEIQSHEKYEIECKTFSDWTFENKIDKVDFIKIDAEGHDIEVIRGMFNWLETIQNKPYILFETGWYIDRENELMFELETKFGYEKIQYKSDILLKPKQ